MPSTYPSQAVPPNAYPTPPRFIGAVLRFLLIATLDRFVRRVGVRLAGRQVAPSADRRNPASGSGHGEAHR